MAYPATTVKQLRQEGGSLLNKIATEFGLIETELKKFQSTEVTSNGSAKTTAHGLGAIPTTYFAVVQEFGASQNPNISCTADGTNITVTAASTDVKYIVFAWL
jgi:hypothetical protein